MIGSTRPKDITAGGLIAVLGWDSGDFLDLLPNIRTRILKQALCSLQDPKENGPEAYDDPLYKDKSRAGVFMIKKELSKRIGKGPPQWWRRLARWIRVTFSRPERKP